MKTIATLMCCVSLSAVAISGCNEPAPNPETSVQEMVSSGETTGDRLNVTVSILPQQYFVEKIGGDRVKVQVMVPEGTDPETYEPKPQQLTDLSEADTYIATGIFFEEIWAERIKTTNSEMLLTDSSAGIEKIAMVAHSHNHDDHSEAEHSEHEEHDHDEEHSEHEDYSEAGNEQHDDRDRDLKDPHTWLSPKLAKVHAQNIYDTLVELEPASEAVFKENLDTLLAEIDELDQAIATTLENLSSRSFLVFHPAWGYFAEDYDLEQIPIEVQGQEPSAAELAELITVAEAENIQVVFAQYQFNSRPAQTIADEIGGKVIFIDPLSADWANNLKEIAQQIALANTP
ncbi:MAG: zinc ABC transporter substrate-binding protein [Limnothrix sp.]